LEGRDKEDQPFLSLTFLALKQHARLGIHVCSFHFWLELVESDVPLYVVTAMVMMTMQ
jgi:hypothetical protein